MFYLNVCILFGEEIQIKIKTITICLVIHHGRADIQAVHDAPNRSRHEVKNHSFFHLKARRIHLGGLVYHVTILSVRSTVVYGLVIIRRCVIIRLGFILRFGLVMPIFGFQLPHVSVRVLHVVRAHFVQDLLQVGDGLPGALGKIFDVVVLKR